MAKANGLIVLVQNPRVLVPASLKELIMRAGSRGAKGSDYNECSGKPFAGMARDMKVRRTAVSL